MKETNKLKKKLKKMKKQYTHYIALRKIEDTELGQKHYLFNCGRINLKETKRTYKRLKKAICDKQNLAKY